MASSSPSTLKLHHGFNRGRHSPDFTPEMRDRQARGKDPEKEEEVLAKERVETDDDASENSSYEKERRGEAMSVLDNPEALLAQAQANDDSVTGQRARFLRQLCGYDDDRDRQFQPMRSSKGQQYAGDRGSR
ncbi:hypothetical protein N0V84_001323 [Fusarium piperis]|uniref:Uncharacterized protein n=1 Tax=Fusarium piperis TaxID=1435070 RepID=A0A9W8WLA2_9HYPO|nr:hypothetical protein N0V84_001323 [Fusarium piperis]